MFGFKRKPEPEAEPAPDGVTVNVPQPAEPIRDYRSAYSETGFWKKIAWVAERAGYELLEKALWLYYAAQRPETPQWARITAYGALGYFILPFDAIPDWLAGIGLTDDLGALTVAVITISQYIDDGVRRRASDKLESWFGRRGASGVID